MGDRFYLCDNQILCEYDYEERVMFASLTASTTPQSTTTAMTTTATTTTLRAALNPPPADPHQVPAFGIGNDLRFHFPSGRIPRADSPVVGGAKGGAEGGAKALNTPDSTVSMTLEAIEEFHWDVNEMPAANLNFKKKKGKSDNRHERKKKRNKNEKRKELD